MRPNVGARRRRGELEEAVSPLQGGAAYCPQTWGRKRALGTHGPLAIPQDPKSALEPRLGVGHVGRRTPFPYPVWHDDFSRECLATIVDNPISGECVARELDAIAERRSYPCMVVSDNGTDSHQMPCSPGGRTAVSSGTILRPENRCRTASWKASTDASGTSARTSISAAIAMPARSSKNGGLTTTCTGHTHRP